MTQIVCLYSLGSDEVRMCAGVLTVLVGGID